MIISVIAQKGGVGKTTTAAALAQGLTVKSKRNKVLLIDTDGQASLTQFYGLEPGEGLTLYEVIKGECSAADAIRTTDCGDIIPACDNLYGLDVELQKKPGRDNLLKKMLEGLEDVYTHIIIDTAPGVGTCLIQALTASDGVIIPVTCERQAYTGLQNALDTVAQVKEYCNADLTILGVLITSYSSRTVLSRQYEELIQNQLKAEKIRLFKTRIRHGVAVQEAQALGRNLFTYAPKSKPAEDYTSLIKEARL